MIKKLVKYIFPENIKKQFRKVENFITRLKYAFYNPIIITNTDKSKLILEPSNSTPIRWIINKSSYKKELDAINKLSSKYNDVFFDVGANIGLITISVAKKFKKVFTFEPLLDTYIKLQNNICINHFTNVVTENIAISDKSGVSTFYINLNNSELNSLGNAFDEKKSKIINVNTDTIDNYCLINKIPKIDLLKIDTEGFELEVLKGTSNMLSLGNILYIQFEISTIPLKKLNKTSKEIFDYLSKYGYKSYDYSEKENKFIGPVTDSNVNYNNFYASKEDLTKK